MAFADPRSFAGESSDAVSERSVLYHVVYPSPVVHEAVACGSERADFHRFGQGSPPAKLSKLYLFKMPLWAAFHFPRTREKHCRIHRADGLFDS